MSDYLTVDTSTRRLTQAQIDWIFHFFAFRFGSKTVELSGDVLRKQANWLWVNSWMDVVSGCQCKQLEAFLQCMEWCLIILQPFLPIFLLEVQFWWHPNLLGHLPQDTCFRPSHLSSIILIKSLLTQWVHIHHLGMDKTNLYFPAQQLWHFQTHHLSQLLLQSAQQHWHLSGNTLFFLRFFCN